MSLIVGTLIVVGAFAALVIGVPWIFASSGGGVIIGAAIAYAVGLAITRRIAKKRDRLATVLLLAVSIGVTYTYFEIMDRSVPPGARGGAEHPAPVMLMQLADNTSPTFWLAWLVSPASMFVVIGIAAAVLMVVVFAWRVIAGRER